MLFYTTNIRKPIIWITFTSDTKTLTKCLKKRLIELLLGLLELLFLIASLQFTSFS